MTNKFKSHCLALLLTSLLPLTAAHAMGPRGSVATTTLTQSYTWHDGDREQTVWVNPTLVAEFGAAGRSAHQTERAVPGAHALPNARGGARLWNVGNIGADSALRSLRATEPSGRYSPVFHDAPHEGGRMRSLPGNAIVYFKADRSESQIRAWVAAQNLEIVRKLNIGKNAYVIRTEPGIVSLETANKLRLSNDVETAMPDWWLDVRTR